MATVINVEKNTVLKPKLSNQKEKSKVPPLFRKINFILMGITVLLLVVGYVLLSGGGSESDEIFSEALFSTQRMTVAPTMILAGLVL